MAQESGAIKIVLIDDEKSFCDLFSFALKKAGFNVKYYTDPKEALLKVIEDKPDSILLDIAIPELNGFNLFSHIKKDLQEKIPKIIFLTNLKYTANGTPIDENYIKSMGADGIIHKTEDLDKIIEKIKELFQK